MKIIHELLPFNNRLSKIKNFYSISPVLMRSILFGSRPPESSLLPKHVWSLSGGAYTQTRHWKRNTTAVFGLTVLICCGLVYIAKDKEIRPRVPDRWIPSMLYDKELERAYLNNKK